MNVTVIGLGPMGRAMAAALLRAGHAVTVWNRSSRRAQALVAAGAALARTPGDAVTASDLTILSLTDYAAMYDILGSLRHDALKDRTLVNLSSDTPNASRDAATWAASYGADFLTGGVMVPAPAIGEPGAFTFYSGPRVAFERFAPVLALLAEPRYLGADHGLAQLFYQAHLDVFLTTLSGILHATALVAAEGVDPAAFLPGALGMVTAIPAMIGDAADLAAQLKAGEHPGDLSTTLMMGATAEHILRASTSAGIDLDLPKAVRSHYERAITAGHGSRNWTALYEVIKA